MADTFTQAERLIRIETPLGPDTLLLRSFTGTEGISRLFRFHLDMMSEEPAIDFDRIIGQNVTVAVRLADGSSYRFFNGHISRFVQLPGEGRLARYQADMVPWLWFLTRTSDCRIFQNKSVPDIVQEVFQDLGFQDFEPQLQGAYEPWEYCVQYRETAFNFVSRLLEQEGIFYFFRHENGKHVMVLADAPSAHRPCPDMPSARYDHVVGRGYRRDEDVVLQWRSGQEMRPGKYALNDYNFLTPRTSLLCGVDSRIDQGGNLRYEVYDYPGEYLQRGQGDALVRLRMEEQELPHAVVEGESNCRAFASGFRFELRDHERRDQNGQYVLTSITHNAHSGGFFSDRPAEDASYSNTFVCTPFSVAFRPPRVTAKPVVQGPQTAVVVGPSGEEIHTDAHSRVRVQFHWDRRGNRDEKSSCFIRVSQPWAGKAWGAIMIPRIGQEVVVDFLEGDPDRPLITGRVYNADQMPPYSLPANQTQSGIKSRSSKGGSSANFNEIRFEDKKGQELLTIHAERNLSTSVEADEFRSVGRNRSTTIKKDETLIVSDGNRKETLEKGNDTLEIWQGNRDTTLMQGDDCLLVQTGNIEVEAPAGKHNLTAREVLTTGLVGITLTCGGSTIKLTPASIDITSPLINIKGGLVKINC
ncbi:MAG: type VI secretion system tip protein VgrG [Bryobacterales bacterium]|nr:type VI secretion system tip protein VgrG [Bryobacterales bacterium]